MRTNAKQAPPGSLASFSWPASITWWRSSSTPSMRRRSAMSDPAVYNDHREAAEAGRRLKELEGPYKLAQEWRQAQADLADARRRSRAGLDGRRVRAGAGAARAGAPAGAGRARPGRLQGRHHRGTPGSRRRRGGALGRRRAAHARALCGAARLPLGGAVLEPERGGRRQGGALCDQGRRRLLDLQVGGRHPPRSARA